MTIITLSRQLASQGDEIALAVAQRLSLRVVGRELVNQAASRALTPEVALSQIDELGLLGIRPSPEAIRQYRECITEVILEFAALGNLILVGRGGQVVLAGYPGVLRVRVMAPMAARITTMCAQSGVSEEVARARLGTSDKARAGYLRRLFGVSADDPSLYDLVINTARIGVTNAVDVVCAAAATGQEAARQA